MPVPVPAPWLLKLIYPSLSEDLLLFWCFLSQVLHKPSTPGCGNFSISSTCTPTANFPPTFLGYSCYQLRINGYNQSYGLEVWKRNRLAKSSRTRTVDNCIAIFERPHFPVGPSDLFLYSARQWCWAIHRLLSSVCLLSYIPQDLAGTRNEEYLNQELWLIEYGVSSTILIEVGVGRREDTSIEIGQKLNAF